MKKLLLITTLTAFNAFGWPDFSGFYASTSSTDGEIFSIQEIKQNGCESMDISVYDETGDFEYYTYHWILNSEYQEGPMDEDEQLLGEFEQETFHSISRNLKRGTRTEVWSKLLENGDIERMILEEFPNGKVTNTTSVLKRVADM